MRPPLNNWPQTENARGGLFFVQLMTELLSLDSFESFRVRSLDVFAKISEAKMIIEDVEKGRVPRKALDPIWAELIESLKEDQIIADELPAKIEIITKAFLQESSLVQLTRYLVFLENKIKPSYKLLLEKRIADALSDSNGKILLRDATSAYCAYVLNGGYSKDYVRSVLHRLYLSQDILRVRKNMFASFFGNFSGTLRKFIITTPISDGIAAYIEPLTSDKILRYRKLSSSDKAKLSSLYMTGHKFLECKVSAHDSYRAVEIIEQKIQSIISLAFLVPKGHILTWGGDMLVRSSRSAESELVSRRGSLHNASAGAPGARAVKQARNYSKRILGNFDASSTERLLSSVNTGSLARNFLAPENQIISLWSAIEVLLSEPEPNTPRIMHYVRLLVPCICLRHIRRQGAFLCDEMIISYKRKFKDIVEQEEGFVDSSYHTRFMAILLMKKNSNLQAELMALCSNNPLAMHRLWKFGNDWQPKCAHKCLASHASRVEWQLHRIYRARNNAVHRGATPGFLDSLAQNAFEYYRSSIATVVNHVRASDHKANIDQAISEIGLEYENYLHILMRNKGLGDMDIDLVGKLLHEK